jgi:hypothetical protein
MSDGAQEFEVVTTRTVTINGTDEKPALRLTSDDGEVKLELLPKNGGRRAPVKRDVLAAAIEALA